MKITTTTSLVGFLLALSALNSSAVSAPEEVNNGDRQPPTVENRLVQLTAALRQREGQQPGFSPSTSTREGRVAQWDNWRNIWQNSPVDGGGFGNWRNNWRDKGGFYNFRNQNHRGN